MSRTKQVTQDERKIRNYLMGELSAPAAEELESRLFVQDELFLQVEDVERSLADDFALGDMSGEERIRFLELCARSPRLERMVEESMQLHVALERRAALTGPIRRRRLYAYLAPVLAAVACLVLGYLLLHHREAPQTATRVAGGVPMAVPQARPEQPMIAAAPTFFLAAIVTRGSVEEPVLRIPPETEQINVQLELAGDAPNAPNWKIDLLSKDRSIQVAADSHPQRVGPVVFLGCRLDTENLPDGRYVLRFSALANPAAPLTRAFRIRRSR